MYKGDVFHEDYFPRWQDHFRNKGLTSQQLSIVQQLWIMQRRYQSVAWQLQVERQAVAFAWLLICSSGRLKVESPFSLLNSNHASMSLKQSQLAKSGRSRNQVTVTLQDPTVRELVGCDVRHTDLNPVNQRNLQELLDHSQEGTRESRPWMGTCHQQQHLWMACIGASQCWPVWSGAHMAGWLAERQCLKYHVKASNGLSKS